MHRIIHTGVIITSLAMGAALGGCATQDGPGGESVARGDDRPVAATHSTTSDLRKPAGGVPAVMQRKLDHANGVLRSLAVEDFPTMTAHAKELVKLTQEGQWATIERPDYQRYSEEFMRAVQSLGADGETNDVDGATLHYFQMTLACVNCHRYIRKIRQ